MSRLGDAGEAGDRGAVDPLAAVDDVAEDGGGDGDALDDAHDIGELEVDELDAFGFDPGEDLFLRRRFAEDGLPAEGCFRS